MSGFLLDTNVISEMVKPKPEPRVKNWIEGIDENLLHLSVLTIGEIRKGVAALPQSVRRTHIEAWLENDLRNRFAGRMFPVTEEVADRWGIIAGQAYAKKRPIPVIDGLLAATALHHNLTLVTRNVEDVAMTGVNLFSPWEDK